MWPTYQFLYDKPTYMNDWSIPNQWPPLMWSTRQSSYDSPTNMIDLLIFYWWGHSCGQLINLLTTTLLTWLTYWFSIDDPHSCDRLVSFITIGCGQLIDLLFEFSYNSLFIFFLVFYIYCFWYLRWKKEDTIKIYNLRILFFKYKV